MPASDAGKIVDRVRRAPSATPWSSSTAHILEREDGGYSPFRVDITDIRQCLGGRQLDHPVRVDASLGEGLVLRGAGLYRHVWLVETAPVHVPQWGRLRPRQDRRDESRSIPTWSMRVDARPRPSRVSHAVLDASGKPVLAVAPAAGRIPAWERRAACRRP
ncbi:hypothetical protein ACRAWD_03455 [Caulobacter segnis]